MPFYTQQEVNYLVSIQNEYLMLQKFIEIRDFKKTQLIKKIENQLDRETRNIYKFIVNKRKSKGNI
jgi:hypothetical protein